MCELELEEGKGNDDLLSGCERDETPGTGKRKEEPQDKVTKLKR
jgi:hypothetical protein